MLRRSIRICLLVAGLCCFAITCSGGNALAQEIRITHGPMLGRLGAHEVKVWARLSIPGWFLVRYGEDPTQLNQTSSPVNVYDDRDCTGAVTLTNLKANTRYHYRLSTANAADVDGPWGGSFRTLPDPAELKQPEHNPQGLFNFSFQIGSCANQGPEGLGAKLPAYGVMLPQLRDKIYFHVMNGDWLYEEGREFTVPQWRKLLGMSETDLPPIARFAPTITGVWNNYRLYHEHGTNLAAWHREIPSFFTFDDHEILNDVIACGQVGYRDRRTVFRDIALQAWYDYLGWANPVAFKQGIHFGQAKLAEDSDVLTDLEADFSELKLDEAATLHVHWGTPDAGINDVKLDEKGGDPNAGVYRIVKVLSPTELRIEPKPKVASESMYSIGRRSYYRQRVGNMDLFFIDTRTHRDRHDGRDPAKPGVSMLGKEQREWLLREMAASDADFLAMVSSVNFMIPHDGAGGMSAHAVDKDDAWTAFVDEREQLIAAWEKLDKPVLVFTGDLHNSFAIRITPKIWEFCCGPHNSRNHPLGSEGRRPPNGPFTSRGRACDIRWSTFFLDDTPRELRGQPVYAVVQVNNVFNNPIVPGQDRWIAYPKPQVIVKYHDGLTGEMLYAEAVRKD